MIINGGYQIIDLKGKKLTNGGSITNSGVYEKLANSHGKPIYVTGINNNTVIYNDTFAECYISGTSYVVKFANVTLTVANTDTITVALA